LRVGRVIGKAGEIATGEKVNVVSKVVSHSTNIENSSQSWKTTEAMKNKV
jgi:hypothetical protein